MRKITDYSLSLIRLQAKYKEIRVFLCCVILNTFLGTVNLLINLDTIHAAAVNNHVPVALLFISVPCITFVVHAGNVLFFALITYFIAAFMGVGFQISVFIKLASRSLASIPVMTFIDCLAFLLLGQKLTTLTWLGFIGYFPFYYLLFYSTSYYTPTYIPLTPKQNKIFTIISTLIMCIATYPYTV